MKRLRKANKLSFAYARFMAHNSAPWMLDLILKKSWIIFITEVVNNITSRTIGRFLKKTVAEPIVCILDARNFLFSIFFNMTDKTIYVNLDNVSMLEVNAWKMEIVVHFPSGNWKRQSIIGVNVLLSKWDVLKETLPEIFANCDE